MFKIFLAGVAVTVLAFFYKEVISFVKKAIDYIKDVIKRIKS